MPACIAFQQTQAVDLIEKLHNIAVPKFFYAAANPLDSVLNAFSSLGPLLHVVGRFLAIT
jgi:hypothetical protein